MFSYSLEHIFSYTATLNPPEVIGPVPEGIRLNYYVTGGQWKGQRLKGRFFLLVATGLQFVLMEWVYLMCVERWKLTMAH